VWQGRCGKSKPRRRHAPPGRARDRICFQANPPIFAAAPRSGPVEEGRPDTAMFLEQPEELSPARDWCVLVAAGQGRVGLTHREVCLQRKLPADQQSHPCAAAVYDTDAIRFNGAFFKKPEKRVRIENRRSCA